MSSQFRICYSSDPLCCLKFPNSPRMPGASARSWCCDPTMEKTGTSTSLMPLGMVKFIRLANLLMTLLLYSIHCITIWLHGIKSIWPYMKLIIYDIYCITLLIHDIMTLYLYKTLIGWNYMALIVYDIMTILHWLYDFMTKWHCDYITLIIWRYDYMT